MKKFGGRLITAIRNRQHKLQENRNSRETKLGGKTTVWIFQVTHKRNLTWVNLDMAKKWKSPGRNWISPDSHSKQRHKDQLYQINKTQQNSKCKLCSGKDETINHIINECSKLAPKLHKTRHVWVGKVIHWELCKKFKFENVDKWYMHNPESIPQNETQ